MMTEQERELYLQIKQNPDDPRFKMLFELDENGKAAPKRGQTLKLLGDGVPFIVDIGTIGILNGNYQDLLASVRTNISFREILNEIAMESPFGKKSAFYREEREIIKGGIPKL